MWNEEELGTVQEINSVLNRIERQLTRLANHITKPDDLPCCADALAEAVENALFIARDPSVTSRISLIKMSDILQHALARYREAKDGKA